MRYLVVLLSFLLSSCATNYYLDNDQLANQSRTFRETVYIADENNTNVDTLVEAGIYTVSANEHETYRIQSITKNRYPVCGMPMIGTIFTLGLLPGILPDYSYFEYELVGPEGTRKFRHVLPIYSRTSIWEWLFKPFSDREHDLEVESLRRAERKSVDS